MKLYIPMPGISLTEYVNIYIWSPSLNLKWQILRISCRASWKVDRLLTCSVCWMCLILLSSSPMGRSAFPLRKFLSMDMWIRHIHDYCAKLCRNLQIDQIRTEPATCDPPSERCVFIELITENFKFVRFSMRQSFDFPRYLLFWYSEEIFEV